MATVNGKQVLVNEQILLLTGEQVLIGKDIAVTVKIEDDPAVGFTIKAVAGAFTLHVNGLEPGADKAIVSNGTLNGQSVSLRAVVRRGYEFADKGLYQIQLTIAVS
ncbi:hypothetical protein [Sphingobium sp.]|uniref:hypothetical protein n=1 Tax=Sphingobium TaxID=165695 RepID=UPI001A21C5F5|nr:hypothetical protein [Sphingobium sp.]MBJ7376382.1 hypothetical protein [Sphingobium sp.]